MLLPGKYSEVRMKQKEKYEVGRRFLFISLPRPNEQEKSIIGSGVSPNVFLIIFGGLKGYTGLIL